MSQKWPLLSGITRNVRKLASLSGSRNFRWGGGGGGGYFRNSTTATII